MVKHVRMTPWECLCVDVIGLYMLQETNSCNTCYIFTITADPAKGRLEIADLITVVSVDKTGATNQLFGNPSTRTSSIVNKILLS